MVTLRLLPGTYAICRLEPGTPVPSYAPPDDGLVSISLTARELSIVCPEERAPREARIESEWRALEVAGPLDLALVGVLSSLTAPLAEAEISVFAVSTYDTDFLLVKDPQVGQAARSLRHAGHQVVV